MPRNSYRLTVLGSALSWLLVGLHASVVHDLTHASPRWGLLALTAVLVVLAAAGTWLLLRAPGPATPRSASEPPDA